MLVELDPSTLSLTCQGVGWMFIDWLDSNQSPFWSMADSRREGSRERNQRDRRCHRTERQGKRPLKKIAAKDEHTRTPELGDCYKDFQVAKTFGSREPSSVSPSITKFNHPRVRVVHVSFSIRIDAQQQKLQAGASTQITQVYLCNVSPCSVPVMRIAFPDSVHPGDRGLRAPQVRLRGLQSASRAWPSAYETARGHRLPHSVVVRDRSNVDSSRQQELHNLDMMVTRGNIERRVCFSIAVAVVIDSSAIE